MLDACPARDQQLLGWGMINEGRLVVTLIVYLLFGRQVFGLLDVEQAMRPQ
ncbi:hypothetical protein D3C81_2332530 [compost metagenome]